MSEFALTTLDNPFDPFEQPEEWYTYDLVSGYRTYELLARFAVVSSDWSEQDYKEAVHAAMWEIAQLLPFYKIVSREPTKT